MYQIDTSTAVAQRPAISAAGTPGYFTGGNPAAGLPATVVSADFLNMLQDEGTSVVLASGQTLDKANNAQLLPAIQRLAQIAPFNAAMAAATGGYPLNALVSGTTAGQIWVSTAAGNTTVPGATGANWQLLFADYQTSSSGTSPNTGDSSNIIWSRTGNMVRMLWNENNVYDGKNIVLPYTFSAAYAFGDCVVAPASYSAWLGGTVGGNVLTVKAGKQSGSVGNVVNNGDGFSGSLVVEGVLAS